MKIVYAQEEFPEAFSKSIMLCGPTPRDEGVNSWRPEAIRILEKLKYDGIVFIPEIKNNKDFSYEWEPQVQWEHDAMEMSDCVLFWIPRDMNTLPGLTTNDEWGTYKKSGKVILGCPDDAVKTEYQKHYAKSLTVPFNNTLEATITAALEFVENGEERKDGERNIPLFIWKTNAFQSWYNSRKESGNRLVGAELLWNFRVGKEKRNVFSFVLKAQIYVKSEDRVKDNEFVFSRTDVVNTVLFKRGSTINDTEVLLIKEFRTPVRNKESFVYELPGGSSTYVYEPLDIVALNELKEETGLSISSDRLNTICSKQLAATLSSHTSSLFSIELNEKEMNSLKEVQSSNKTFGNENDTEITYVCIVTVDDLLKNKIPVDWSVLGMVLKVLNETL